MIANENNVTDDIKNQIRSFSKSSVFTEKFIVHLFILKMYFSKNELIDMIYVLGEADKNCLLAERLYRTKYPERRTPSPRSFQNLMERFDSTGSVEYSKHKVVNKIATNDEKELEILLQVQENPQISSRKLASLCDTSRSTANRTTCKYKYHPYHIELHQELQDQDFQRRVTYCQWLRAQIGVNQKFLKFIMYSDEARFRSIGAVNRHNMHYYATENPHWVREVRHQNHWSFNV